MKRGRGLRLFLYGLSLAAIIFFIGALALLSGSRPRGERQKRIVRIDILGPITSAGETIEKIKKYSDDTSVSALLIRIDSPGGAVTPSQEIYDELLRVREKGDKIVVASIGNLGVSGGYYIAAAAEKIYANPGSLVGSIGVILQLTKVNQLLEKIGIDSEVIKSGPYKDIGSPLRATTVQERNLLQAVIDDTHLQFIKAVSAGRALSQEKVTSLADGRVFTGMQARELGMVDEIGGLEDAIKGTASIAGIEGKPVVIDAGKKWGWRHFLENISSLVLTKMPINNTSGLMYLWKP